MGLRAAAGELVGLTVELVGAVATGLAMGKANVGDGKADPVNDVVEDGDGVTVGDGKGLGVRLGVGEGGMMFSH